jgi:hypothetical protein
MNTVVLVFEADELAKFLKNEPTSCQELVRSYKQKLPSRNQQKPSFSQFYQKIFHVQQPSTHVVVHSTPEPDHVEKGMHLPTKSLRALLITGFEADRRQEFDEIVSDFPKLNDQKQLTIISELNASIDKTMKKSIDSEHSPTTEQKDQTDSIWKRRAEFL